MLMLQSTLFRSLKNVRFASDITSKDVTRAFTRELNEIKARSSLMNQNSWQSLAKLEDIGPMMEIFKQLTKVDGALNENTVLHAVTALNRSVKDCPVLFRSALESVRSTYQSETYLALANHCDTIAEAIIANTIPATNKIIGTLLSTYETVDPAKGAAFYVEGNFLNVGGSVIPCLVKSSAPLGLIEQAYERTPRKSPRVRANMAWAYLKYNKVAEALKLKSQIRDAPLSAEKFLVSAFVGDAPLDVALAEFENSAIPPHHASVVRLLNNAWTVNNDTTQQLHIFEKFLKLARGSQESAFKPVTYAVTQNIVNQRIDFRTLVNDVKKLISTYTKHPSKAIFLNILLTHVSKHRGKDEQLIMPILQAYGADTLSPVTYRVRLNSLARVNPENKEVHIRKIWAARSQLSEPIDSYDWMALAKADRELAKEIYAQTEEKPANPKIEQLLSN